MDRQQNNNTMLKICPHVLSPLEGDFSAMFHTVNRINNSYNFVKFIKEFPRPTGAHLMKLNYHLLSDQRGKMGSLSPRPDKGNSN